MERKEGPQKSYTILKKFGDKVCKIDKVGAALIWQAYLKYCGGEASQTMDRREERGGLLT